MNRASVVMPRLSSHGLVRLALALVAAAQVARFQVPRAHASIVLALDLPDLVGRADRIVVADVVNVTCAWDRAHRTILSTIELAVGESWKGSVGPTRRLSIVQVGGQVDGVEMTVVGQATFVPSERVVLFLRGSEDRAGVVGLGQGKRSLHFDPARQTWMASGGDRSAAVHIDGAGRMLPAAPEAPVSLSLLRQQVTALVKR